MIWCKTGQTTGQPTDQPTGQAPIPYFEVSAKDGINVNDAFETIARNALAHSESFGNEAGEMFGDGVDDSVTLSQYKSQTDNCAC